MAKVMSSMWRRPRLQPILTIHRQDGQVCAAYRVWQLVMIEHVGPVLINQCRKRAVVMNKVHLELGSWSGLGMLGPCQSISADGVLMI